MDTTTTNIKPKRVRTEKQKEAFEKARILRLEKINSAKLAIKDERQTEIKPAKRPVGRPAKIPVVKPAEDPVVKPAEEPVVASVVETAVEPVGVSAGDAFQNTRFDIFETSLTIKGPIWTEQFVEKINTMKKLIGFPYNLRNISVSEMKNIEKLLFRIFEFDKMTDRIEFVNGEYVYVRDSRGEITGALSPVLYFFNKFIYDLERRHQTVCASPTENR
jgi:hypothetical protein